MPVLDGNFEAFVTNLGKYNEGMLVGEWVKLPTTEEEMQKVFERIGIGKQDEFGQPYEEWFITDYECPIYGVQKMLGEYESLDKLNFLASLIDEAVAQGKNPSAAASLRLNASRSAKTLAIDPLISKKQITQTGPSE